MVERLTLADGVVLIDADPIVYRSAFAAQKKAEDGSDWTVVEPIENVLATVKRTLASIREAASSDHTEIYLTVAHGKSFRHELAKQRPYKGNRTKPRPYYYDAVREYLVRWHSAKVVTAREADDELSIRAHQLRRDGIPYVVATIDKDLDQIPGTHYNYRDRLDYEVGEEDADRWFWIQALAGDPTDNVPGCWKIGAAKAETYIDAWLRKQLEPEEVWTNIVGVYDISRDRADCPYRDAPPEDVALETAQLVYLQRMPGELWLPPQAGGPRLMSAGENVQF